MTTKEFDIAVTAFVLIFRANSLKNAFGFRKDGGPGSGNFEHGGRPGEIGGSAPTGQGTKEAHAYGKSVSERKAYRAQKFKEYKERIGELRPVLKMKWEVAEAKRSYVRMFDQQIRRYEDLEKEGYADAAEKISQLKEERKPFDKEYADALADHQKTVEEARGIAAEYTRETDELNSATLKMYPNYESIKSGEDASEYLTAKGYFQPKETDYPPYGTVGGLPAGAGGADLNRMTPEMAVATVKTVDQIYGKYPELSQVMRALMCDEAENGALGDYGGGAIHLDATQYSENAERQTGGFHPVIKGAEPFKAQRADVAHEFGHALDDLLSRKYPDSADYVSTGKYSTTATVAPIILKRAAKNLGMTQTQMKANISGYACKSSVEALAEAFSEYIVSGSPRPEAAEIGRQIDAFYRTGKTVGKR